MQDHPRRWYKYGARSHGRCSERWRRLRQAALSTGFAPSKGPLFGAWLEAAGDLEKCLGTWAAHGVPFNIEALRHPTLRRLWPGACLVTTDAHSCGRSSRATSSQATASPFQRPHLSGSITKMARILSRKTDGSKKARIIVDDLLQKRFWAWCGAISARKGGK